MAAEEDVGIVGGVNVGLPILMTMGAFLAIALYNVIELTFLIFAIFKERRGLYFWSFVIATWGIVPHGVGFILKFFQVTRLDLLSAGIVGVGWVCMVIGQSVVLFSRLHLVVRDKNNIRWVLYMIIFNAVGFGVPLIVLAMGTNSPHSARFLPGFMVWDKVQIVVYSVQEGIISVIYIYETIHLLGNGSANTRGPLRKLLSHLIIVNVMVLIFDITLLAVQFSGHYEIQTTYKTAVYSVKLKIEFSVLNRLVDVVKNGNLVRNRSGVWAPSFSLSTWARSKKTHSTAGRSAQGFFSKIDDEHPKPPIVKTSEVIIERESSRDREGPTEPELSSKRFTSPDIAHLHPRDFETATTSSSNARLGDSYAHD